MQVRSHLCSNVRYPRADCRRCREICPASAIQIHRDSVILDDRCSGCEICVSACPNGVFALTPPKVQERWDQLRQQVARSGVARFSCALDKQSEREGMLVVPCLAGLSEACLVAPFAWGAEKVLIKRIGCEGCPSESGMVQYDRLMKAIGHLLSCFGVSSDRIEEVSVLNRPADSLAGSCRGTQKRLGRRELLGLFRKRALETTRRLMPEEAEEVSESRWTHEQSPLRSFLLERLHELAPPGDDRLNSQVFPALNLNLSEACIGCNVCETLCPTGAIRREVEEGRETRLLFRLSRCTGCKICSLACLTEAVSFSETFSATRLIQGTERELIRIAAKKCSLCGRLFQGIPGDHCSQCFGSPDDRIR